jgi:hypothetical protein
MTFACVFQFEKENLEKSTKESEKRAESLEIKFNEKSLIHSELQKTNCDLKKKVFL